MTAPVRYLELDDVVTMAARLLGDPPPIKDLGLLGSAVARPQASAFGIEAYPDLVSKAAAMLQSLVNNHALVDGNKRLGWLATAVFLELNTVEASTLPNDEVFDLVMWIVSSAPDLEEISIRLGQLLFRS